MADLSAKIAKAKQAGYSDAEIADFLASDPALAPKIQTAKQSGYDDAEIIGFLASSGSAAPKPTAPKPKRNLVQDITGAAANFNRGLFVGDEIAAGLRTAGDVITGRVRPSRRPDGSIQEADIGGAFRENMARQRQTEDEFTQARPKVAALSRGTGNAIAAAVPTAPAANALAAGSRAVNMARGATSAALSAGGYAAADRGTGQERIAAFNEAATNPLVLGLGAAAGALSPTAPKAKPNALADQLQQFDGAGVRMPMAAAGPGRASVAKAMAENPIAGIRARRMLQDPIDDTAAAAERVASQYGRATSREVAGDAVQDGIGAFNRRFSTRASTLYDKAFDDIERGQQAALAKASEQSAFVGAGGLRPSAPIIEPRATKQALGGMSGRVNAPMLADIIVDPRLSRVARALDEGSTDIRFGDLRALRTWTREAQKNETLRQGIDQAGLQRLERALTEDIQQNAMNLAGPAAARRLRQADTFYRIGSQRIENQLQVFLGKNQPKSPEAAYDMIVQAASEKGGANAQRLEALRKSLQPEEWNDLSATVIQRMGDPPPGVKDTGPFSISGFVTKYETLSPRGKTLLFGTGEERKALDNLVQVASALKDVERAANSSRSGVAVQTVGTVAALANSSTAGAAALSLAAMTATGEAMTNPAFVRWLAESARAARAGRQVQLSTLQALTARDPNLTRIYMEGLAALPRAAGASGVQQRGGSVVVENLDRPDLALGVSSQ